jgi:hypothetical protein
MPGVEAFPQAPAVDWISLIQVGLKIVQPHDSTVLNNLDFRKRHVCPDSAEPLQYSALGKWWAVSCEFLETRSAFWSDYVSRPRQLPPHRLEECSGLAGLRYSFNDHHSLGRARQCGLQSLRTLVSQSRGTYGGSVSLAASCFLASGSSRSTPIAYGSISDSRQIRKSSFRAARARWCSTQPALAARPNSRVASAVKTTARGVSLRN